MSEKIKGLESDAQRLQAGVAEREIEISEKGKACVKAEQNIQRALDDTELRGVKNKALESWITEAQNKYGDVERRVGEKLEFVEELCDKDYSRNCDVLKIEERVLGKLLLEKDTELTDFQKYLTNQYQVANKTPNLHILDEQSKELQALKRNIMENENRNNECQRKWKDLFQVTCLKKSPLTL